MKLFYILLLIHCATRQNETAANYPSSIYLNTAKEYYSMLMTKAEDFKKLVLAKYSEVYAEFGRRFRQFFLNREEENLSDRTNLTREELMRFQALLKELAMNNNLPEQNLDDKALKANENGVMNEDEEEKEKKKSKSTDNIL